MKPILFFRTVDKNGQSDEIAGIDAFIALLKKSKNFAVEYREGTVNNLSALLEDHFVLLAIDSVQARALITAAPLLKQQLFLVGCGFSVLHRIDQLKVAGAIPDLTQLLPSGAYLAYGNKFPLDVLGHNKPAVTQFYSSFALALKETKTAAGIPLGDYLEWYTHLREGLWAGELTLAAASSPQEQANAPAKTPRDSKYSVGNNWQGQQADLRKKREALESKNDLADRSRLTPEQLEAWEKEQQKKNSEEEEREFALPGQLRAAVLDPRFRARPEVKMLMEKKDAAALLALVEMELAANYIQLKYQQPGWPDIKTRKSIQIVRKVGRERDSLKPEKVGERKIITLENATQWVEEAKVDVLLTKTLMEKLDPEVMAMVQGRQFSDPAEAMRGLEKVRGLMRMISSGDAALRFQQGNLRLSNFNSSYWGNEKQVTLALRPGEEGWTDHLPFTDGDLQQIVNELLQAEQAQLN